MNVTHHTEGERSGMHNTCENKHLWKDITQYNHKRDFKLQHTLRGGEIR